MCLVVRSTAKKSSSHWLPLVLPQERSGRKWSKRGDGLPSTSFNLLSAPARSILFLPDRYFREATSERTEVTPSGTALRALCQMRLTVFMLQPFVTEIFLMLPRISLPPSEQDISSQAIFWRASRVNSDLLDIEESESAISFLWKWGLLTYRSKDFFTLKILFLTAILKMFRWSKIHINTTKGSGLVPRLRICAYFFIYVIIRLNRLQKREIGPLLWNGGSIN